MRNNILSAVGGILLATTVAVGVMRQPAEVPPPKRGDRCICTVGNHRVARRAEAEATKFECSAARGGELLKGEFLCF